MKTKNLTKILKDAQQRWNNGGKEIYEALQNNPEFVHSSEYKKYMEDLEKEEETLFENQII